MTHNTARNHLHNILRKTATSSRAELAALLSRLTLPA